MGSAGEAMLFLLPSEAGYVDLLAQRSVKLLLQPLMPVLDCLNDPSEPPVSILTLSPNCNFLARNACSIELYLSLGAEMTDHGGSRWPWNLLLRLILTQFKANIPLAPPI